MDIFGFKTQGVNYDKFRPRYPSAFTNRYIQQIGHKNRYLDIAMGTGQLLFMFAPHFKFSKGVDISKQMIDTALVKAKEFKNSYPESQIQLSVSGVMQMSESHQYDLITVGQALHFFPIEPALEKIKTMLKEDGFFVTFGYILKGVKSNNQQQNDIFMEYYKQVKPLFTFDRDDLHSHYSNKIKYPFEKIFPKVEKEIIQVPLVMNKLEYLSYLKTMSGYNLFLQKNQGDPLKVLQEQCGQEVTCLFDYFRIECSLK